MITGFNTDIEHDGVVYHVQTEDKGLGKPLILSLIYTAGEILASKRSPYNDLITSGFDEKVLIERLNRQHKLICAAVRGGRIDDLKRMSMKNSVRVPENEKENSLTSPATLNGHSIEKQTESIQTVSTERNPVLSNLVTAKTENIQVIPETVEVIELKETNDFSDAKNVPTPILLGENKKDDLPLSIVIDESSFTQITYDDDSFLDIPIDILDDFIIEDVDVLDDYHIVEDVEILTVDEEINGKEPAKTAAQIQEHIDFIESVSRIVLPLEKLEELIIPNDSLEIVTDFGDENKAQNPLQVELVDEPELRGGQRTTINIRVMRGEKLKTNLANAQVVVKVLGSSFRPLIFHARTNESGMASVHLQLPSFRSGRAAILIKAVDNFHEIELRRSISQG